MADQTCTTLDHIYPNIPKGWGWYAPPAKGTPCFCGQRQWGVEHKPRKRRKEAQDAEQPTAA